jgi:hypothetical protein
MTIPGQHFIGGRRGACASNHALVGLGAVTGEAVRATQIEEATS